MLDQIETINDGWLQTRELQGQPGVQITGKYKRPFVPGTTHLKFAVVASCFGILWLWGHGPDVWANVFAGVMAGGIGYSFLGILPVIGIMKLIPREVDVKILAQHIQIKKGRRYRTYSRTMPIEFRVEQHHKAVQEELEEMKRGKAGNRWYREAIEVVMQYGEKRIQIAEMRMVDLEKAKALVIRLQSWCESFDQAVKRMADGQISPAGEMGAVSGGDFGPAPDIR